MSRGNLNEVKIEVWLGVKGKIFEKGNREDELIIPLTRGEKYGIMVIEVKNICTWITRRRLSRMMK